MKILVPLKRVTDPDNANKVRVKDGGAALDLAGLEPKLNPFDAYALEAALRLTEDGKAPKARLGEVIVVTFDGKEAETTLRRAIAMGAQRAIRIECDDAALDGNVVARGLAALARELAPDLVILGKQSVDGDMGYVPQAVAEHLGWPAVTFAATMKAVGGAVEVAREVDGGLMTVRAAFPAVVSVDLRIVAPDSVYSERTDPTFQHGDGPRHPPLPAMLKAKKVPIDVRPLSAVAGDVTPRTTYPSFSLPTARGGGVMVSTVAELVDKLQNEAKVL